MCRFTEVVQAVKVKVVRSPKIPDLEILGRKLQFYFRDEENVEKKRYVASGVIGIGQDV